MPARMLRYRADIWEYTMGMKLGMPSIKQAVIYFYKETLNYSYEAIKVWEIKSDLVIKQELEGLYPLIPLMDSDDDTDEEIMKNTMEVIKTIESESSRKDFLAVMTILAGERFTKELVSKYVRREMIMGSPLYQEWIEEEKKEAADLSAIKSSKTYILGALEAKFDFIPKQVKETIEEINDIDILDRLHNRAVIAVSMESFEEILNKAKTVS